MKFSTPAAVAVVVVVALAAIVGAIPVSSPGGPTLSRADDACDPIDPNYCAFPWPNNFYLVDDPNTDTGKRLELPSEALPVDNEGKPIDPTVLNTVDGFTQIPSMSALFPGVDLDASNTPRHWDIARSLDDDCPTLVIDADTGEKIAHWTELDYRTPNSTPAEQAFIIWPASALTFGHTYNVAIRDLVMADGTRIQPSPAFVALRDGHFTEDTRIEKRRESYEKLFSRVEAAGFERSSLVLAWEFTTASKRSVQTRQMSALEDAMERMRANGGFNYTITSVQDDIGDRVGRRISGTFEVPLYLDSPIPGSHLNLVVDENDRAVYQGMTTALFSLIIPKSVTDGTFSGPRPMVLFGHGLFQNRNAIAADAVTRPIDKHGWIVFATEFWGLCLYDLPGTLRMAEEDLSRCNMVPDRSIQGHVNQQILMNTLTSEAFANDPAMQFNGQSVVDRTERHYFGASLGGIYGSMFMALNQQFDDTEVKTGILGVPGAPFAMMLPRSSDFNIFYDVLRPRYSNPVDLYMLISGIQLIWDRAEIAGFHDLLTNDPNKRIQNLHALGDSQVTYLAAYTMSRSLKQKIFYNFSPARANETVYGFEVINEDTTTDDVCISYNFDKPEVPIYNYPPPGEHNTHETIFDQDTFVERAFILLNENVHAQVCDGECGWDDE